MSVLRQSLPAQQSSPLSDIDIHGQNVAVDIRVNRKAKKIILKVDALKKLILLTCPTKRSIPEAIQFAGQKRDWIAEQLAAGPVAKPFRNGEDIEIEGVPVHLCYATLKTRSVVLVEETATLHVGGDAEFFNRRVIDFLKKRARQRFTEHTDAFCNALSLERRKISIRDPQTRWGSCSSDRTISYSWRLILAPAHVLRYVAAHETAHLVHMDHSPAFWAVVDQLITDRLDAQHWLKAHGSDLHRYGVEIAQN